MNQIHQPDTYSRLHVRETKLIITLLLFIHISTFGQQINKSEELKINQLLERGRSNFTKGNTSSALQAARQAEKRAEKIENVQLSWEAKNLQGEIFLTQQEYEETINLFMEMAMHAEKRENYSISANAYFSLANTFSALSAFDLADQYYQKAYNQFDQIDYELGMVEISLASGYNLIRAHELDSAEKQFIKLLEVALKDNIHYFEYEAYDALVEIYTAKQNPKYGVKYAKAYYDLIKEGGNEKKASLLAYRLSVFYDQMKLKDKSDEFLKIAIDKNPLNKQAYESGNISLVEVPQKLSDAELEKASQYAKTLETKAIDEIDAKDEENLFEETENLKNVQKQEKQQLSKLAHRILLGDETIDHSAITTEYIHQDLLISHHEYETRERQAELARYKLESEKNRLAKENEENKRKIAEEEKLILEQDLEIQKQQRLYFITILVVIIIFIVLLGIEYVRVRRLNKQLAEQKITINDSNIQLQASNEDLQRAQSDLNSSFIKEQKIRKALEKALNDLKQTHNSLIQAEKMSALGMLTAGIAHELKNPINFISNGVELIEENTEEILKHLSTEESENPVVQELKEDIKELIADTRFGTVRIQEIVEGLRVYSRKDDKFFQKADVVQVMNSALLILKPKYKHKAEIVKKYDDFIPEISCFQGELNQVFINIIGNGVDALSDQKHGTITLTINNLDDKHVRIVIQDDGSGIPDEVKAKMFSPLFTTKTQSEGTGLGLSITKDILKKHNGQLHVKTKLGVGTAFVITLPVDQPE